MVTANVWHVDTINVKIKSLYTNACVAYSINVPPVFRQRSKAEIDGSVYHSVCPDTCLDSSYSVCCCSFITCTSLGSLSFVHQCLLSPSSFTHLFLVTWLVPFFILQCRYDICFSWFLSLFPALLLVYFFVHELNSSSVFCLRGYLHSGPPASKITPRNILAHLVFVNVDHVDSCAVWLSRHFSRDRCCLLQYSPIKDLSWWIWECVPH